MGIIPFFGVKRELPPRFAVCWSRLLKYLTKNLFSNMKSLLEHREENMKWFLRARVNYNKFLAIFFKIRELGKTGQFFQVSIHFHPNNLQPRMNDTSFCALVGLLLTNLNHYFDVYIHTCGFFFRYSKTDTKKGDTVPCRNCQIYM